jgi:salicylate hydroxylase
VFEAHAGPDEFGTGVQTSPNGTDLWTRWGLSGALKPLVSTPTALQIFRHDGKLLALRQQYDAEILRRYGNPLWTMHRMDLQNSLVERARELGVNILCSSHVGKVDVSQQPKVTTERGETYIGDLVNIGGGVWTSLWSDVLGRQVNPEPTGDMAYRITVNREQLEGQEDLPEWAQEQSMRIWLGIGSHAVAYPVRQAKQLNIVLIVEDDFKPGGDSRAAGDIEEMRRHFNGWDPV